VPGLLLSTPSNNQGKEKVEMSKSTKVVLTLALIAVVGFVAQAQTVSKWYTNELKVDRLKVFAGAAADSTSKAANYTVVSPTDDFKHFTNAGAVASASEITFTLPTAAAGLSYSFGVIYDATVNVDANSGDKINVLTNAAGDKIQATDVGAHVHLLAIDSTNWLVLKKHGTWADAN
jgi:hypothetical protein